MSDRRGEQPQRSSEPLSSPWPEHRLRVAAAELATGGRSLQAEDSSIPAPTSPLSSVLLSTPPFLPSSPEQTEDAPAAAAVEPDITIYQAISRLGPLSDGEKLLVIFTLLRRWRWTTATYLRQLAVNLRDTQSRHQYHKFQDFAYEEAVQGSQLGLLQSRHIQALRAAADRVAPVSPEDNLPKEVRTLADRSPSYGRRGVEPLGAVNNLFADAVLLAPTWASLFAAVTGKNALASCPGPFVFMLSSLAHLAFRRRSDNFAAVLGLYLYHGGARRRVIDMFARCGLSLSHRTVRRLIRDIAKTQKGRARATGSLPTSVLAYDNYDFAVGRRGERTGDKREHRSITTALTFTGQGLPTTGLRQSMWQPEIGLSAVGIARSVRRTETYYKVCYCMNNPFPMAKLTSLPDSTLAGRVSYPGSSRRRACG